VLPTLFTIISVVAKEWILSGLHHGSSTKEDCNLGDTSSGVSSSCGFYSGKRALSYCCHESCIYNTKYYDQCVFSFSSPGDTTFHHSLRDLYEM